MPGIELLLPEFDADDLPADLAQRFKDLALVLKDLPAPTNVQAIRRLLDARQITVHAH